jgi:hypothetical protein
MAAHNPQFEGKKMKKVNPPKKAGRSAPRTPKKPFRLEVGKTYETRDGIRRVRIDLFNEGNEFPFRGRYGAQGALSWREDGHFYSDVPECADLIREVRQPKAPVAPKGRRAPK